MRVFDSQGRILGRVNVIDLLVLIALAALVVLAFSFFSSPEEQQVIETTFVIERIRDTTVLQLQEGDQIHDRTGTLLGTVVEVRSEPNLVEVPTAEGSLEVEESPLYKDVWLVVRGTGEASSSRVAVGSVPLKVGDYLELSGPTYNVRAQIRRVEVLGAA